MLFVILMVFHVIISVSLVVIVLAQSSKGNAVGGMLGGAATNTFGGQGAADFLKKWTKVIAVIWMLSSIVLALTVNAGIDKDSSAVQQIQNKAKQEQKTSNAPAIPQTGTKSQTKQIPGSSENQADKKTNN